MSAKNCLLVYGVGIKCKEAFKEYCEVSDDKPLFKTIDGDYFLDVSNYCDSTAVFCDFMKSYCTSLKIVGFMVLQASWILDYGAERLEKALICVRTTFYCIPNESIIVLNIGSKQKLPAISQFRCKHFVNYCEFQLDNEVISTVDSIAELVQRVIMNYELCTSTDRCFLLVGLSQFRATAYLETLGSHFPCHEFEGCSTYYIIRLNVHLVVLPLMAKSTQKPEESLKRASKLIDGRYHVLGMILFHQTASSELQLSQLTVWRTWCQSHSDLPSQQVLLVNIGGKHYDRTSINACCAELKCSYFYLSYDQLKGCFSSIDNDLIIQQLLRTVEADRKERDLLACKIPILFCYKFIFFEGAQREWLIAISTSHVAISNRIWNGDNCEAELKKAVTSWSTVCNTLSQLHSTVDRSVSGDFQWAIAERETFLLLLHFDNLSTSALKIRCETVGTLWYECILAKENVMNKTGNALLRLIYQSEIAWALTQKSGIENELAFSACTRSANTERINNWKLFIKGSKKTSQAWNRFLSVSSKVFSCYDHANFGERRLRLLLEIAVLEAGLAEYRPFWCEGCSLSFLNFGLNMDEIELSINTTKNDSSLAFEDANEGLVDIEYNAVGKRSLLEYRLTGDTTNVAIDAMAKINQIRRNRWNKLVAKSFFVVQSVESKVFEGSWLLSLKRAKEIASAYTCDVDFALSCTVALARTVSSVKQIMTRTEGSHILKVIQELAILSQTNLVASNQDNLRNIGPSMESFELHFYLIYKMLTKICFELSCYHNARIEGSATADVKAQVSASLQECVEAIEWCKVVMAYKYEAFRKPQNHYRGVDKVFTIDSSLQAVGKGSFVKTSMVFNNVDKIVYAVKSISLQQAYRPDGIEAEANTLHQLQHLHIVKYFTCFYTRQDTIFNIIMEWVEGESLVNKIGSINAVPIATVFKWLQQLSDALNYLHRVKHIQHKKIEPKNIIVVKDDSIKLIGFGSATETNSLKTVVGKAYSQWTAALLRYEEGDDIWASGLTFAQLLINQSLKDFGELIDSLQKLTSECSSLDESLGVVIEAMLRPRLKDRCSSDKLVKMLLDVKLAIPLDHNEVGNFEEDENQKDEFEDNADITAQPTILALSNEQTLQLNWSEFGTVKFGDRVGAISFNSNCTRIVFNGDYVVKVYEITSQTVIWFNEYKEKVRSVSFSPDDKTVVVGSEDKTLKVLDATNGKKISSTPVESFVHRVCYTRDGKNIIVAIGENRFAVFDDHGKELLDGEIPLIDVSRGICISDDKKIIIGAGMHQISIIENFTTVQWLVDCPAVPRICMNWKQSHLIVGTSLGEIMVYVCDTNDLSQTSKNPWVSFMAHEHKAILSLSIGFENQILVSGSADSTVKVWDARTYSCVQVLSGHTNNVTTVRMGAKSTDIVSSSDDGTIRVWKTNSEHTSWKKRDVGLSLTSSWRTTGSKLGNSVISSGKSLGWTQTIIWEFDANIGSISINATCTKVAGNGDTVLRMYDLTDNLLLWETSDVARSCIRSIAFNPKDETTLAVGSNDKTIKLVDSDTGDVKSTTQVQGIVYQVCWAHNGIHLAAASGESQYIIMNVKGELLYKADVPASCSLWFTRLTGSLVGAGNGQITVLENFVDVKWKIRCKIINRMCVDRSGSRVIAGTIAGYLLEFDLTSKDTAMKPKHYFPAHEGSILSMCMSADDEIFVTGSADRLVKVWDAKTCHCKHTLKGHTSDVTTVRIGSDLMTIISSSDDKTVRVWTLADEDDEY